MYNFTLNMAVYFKNSRYYYKIILYSLTKSILNMYRIQKCK